MEQKKGITISLIIPVYKVAPYIERCLKSVIKQTYNHFECILVDDASPDDSIEKCERMIATYNGPIHFRILRHQKNRGLSAARNTGTDAATGDYILYIDSDDLISNDCVEKLIAPLMKDNSIEMVFGGWMRFSDNEPMHLPENFKHEKVVLTTNKEVRDYFFTHQRFFIPAAWNKLISKDFLNRYNLRFIEGQLWEDVVWSFFVIKHLSHLYSIPDVTYFYYKRHDSISEGSNREEENKHKSIISEIISNNFTEGEEGREAAYYFAGFCQHYIILPKNKEFKETSKRFAKALPFRKFPKERMLLIVADILPRNHTGKEVFDFLYKKLYLLQRKTRNMKKDEIKKSNTRRKNLRQMATVRKTAKW